MDTIHTDVAAEFKRDTINLIELKETKWYICGRLYKEVVI